MSITTSQDNAGSAVGPPSLLRRLTAAVGLTVFVVVGGILLAALIVATIAGAVLLLSRGL